LPLLLFAKDWRTFPLISPHSTRGRIIFPGLGGRHFLNIEHWPFGKSPVTVLWVFKLFYDTPAPGARSFAHNERLGHVGRAVWPLLIRHVERANQTLVRPRQAKFARHRHLAVCLLFSFARIMRPKLK